MKSYVLQVFENTDGSIQSSETAVETWSAIEEAIDRNTGPKGVELRVNHATGQPLLYMMFTADRAHLSVWTDWEECHYLTSGPPDRGGSIDIGWNSFPAWLVTNDLSGSVEAARRFFEDGDLAPPLSRWYSEEE